jgi:uncharacterized membrane protein (DUF485 family)
VQVAGGGEPGQDSSTGCSTYKADAAGRMPDIFLLLSDQRRESVFSKGVTTWHTDYKTRLGIWMFILYTLIYAGFITINTVKPTLMEVSFGGLNLAMIYGLGLIIFAFILALIYNSLCTKAEIRLNK